MIYPNNIEYKLGFDQIRDMLGKECLSTLGQAYVSKIRFSKDHDLIEKLLHQTAEFKNILVQEMLFPSQNYIDVTPLLDKLAIEGLFLEAADFFDIKLSLKTIYRCLDFFEENGTAFPFLQSLTEGVKLEKKILRNIEDIIDDKGAVRDNASDELLWIRREIVSEQSHIRKELERILNAVKREGYADEAVAVTIRNGRMVIPVFAEFKRKIKGFIHDESATGQTVFLEPAQVLEINNEIRDLQYREKREVIKILTELTFSLRPFLSELKRSYTFLGLVDFIRAKAKFAVQVQAELPALDKQTVMELTDARHPLLFLNLKSQQKHIVPLNISLHAAQRILVISGPNAGGKSVALKTAGLLQYMLQCGLLIPAAAHSRMGIFQDILIDIGDEQSIENDLSTYSSHLTNMKQFLFYGNPKSLVLIDEFGTGTEPNFGAAIAEAVLERLNALKVYGIITTHYANLKAFSENNPGMVNGAMVFNMEKLEPMYELQTGKPGSSFALEIARKIGLPDDIIENSKNKIGRDQVDFEKLVQELESERIRFKGLNEAAVQKDRSLQEELKKYEALHAQLENHRKQHMNEAREKARALLLEVNQKIENTIRKIKENKADKSETQELRKELAAFTEQLAIEKIELAPTAQEEVVSGPVAEGDYVRVQGSGAIGKVIVLRGKDAEIMIGALKSNVKLQRLEKISRKEYRKQTGEDTHFIGTNTDLHQKMAEFYPSIDLRGKRAEEAIVEVDHLIDNAIMFGVPEVKIVHGKGDGILRTMIRSHLKYYKQVQSCSDEHADRGGAGVTLVRLS